MGEEAKEEIQAILFLLKNALIKHNVSMGVKLQGKEIVFFDTEIYLNEKRVDGFTVNTDDLVN